MWSWKSGSLSYHIYCLFFRGFFPPFHKLPHGTLMSSQAAPGQGDFLVSIPNGTSPALNCPFHVQKEECLIRAWNFTPISFPSQAQLSEKKLTKNPFKLTLLCSRAMPGLPVQCSLPPHCSSLTYLPFVTINLCPASLSTLNSDEWIVPFHLSILSLQPYFYIFNI